MLGGLWALSCGYHFVGSDPALGPDVDRIELRPLENRSNEPGLERALTEALVEEFDRLYYGVKVSYPLPPPW